MIFLVTIVILLTASACVFFTKVNNQPKYHTGGPYYYRTWANYCKPYRPVGEITKSEALDREKKGSAYYEAYFNEMGFITKFIKHYKNEVVYGEEYSYTNGKLTNTIRIEPKNY